jgi:hypothetical protein
MAASAVMAMAEDREREGTQRAAPTGTAMRRSFPGADRLGSVDDRGTSESKGYLRHQGADGWIHRRQGALGKRVLYLRALLEESRATTEAQIDRSHPPESTRTQSLGKLIRNTLEAETHNPIWRVAIFSAITAIRN